MQHCTDITCASRERGAQTQYREERGRGEIDPREYVSFGGETPASQRSRYVGWGFPTVLLLGE